MAFDTSTVNVWAPELFYDEENKRYVIVWASTIPFKFARGAEEERNNHRLYYTTTRDFREFSGAELFFDPGYSVIDGVLVQRTARDYVLVFKDNTRPERNIRVASGVSPLGPFGNISGPLTAPFTEGPTVLKRKGKWLIFYDAYREKNTEPWKLPASPILPTYLTKLPFRKVINTGRFSEQKKKW